MQTLSSIIAESNERTGIQKAPSFTEQEQTKIYNSYSNGWTGNTRVKIAGKCWDITTSKGYRGISTHCHTVTDEGNGAVSYMMFGHKNEAEDFYLNQLPRETKATEKAITEAHKTALAMFNAKKEAGELPALKEEDTIKIGQVLFTDGIGYDEQRRAVYEIVSPNNFKTVLLDGSDLHHDSHVKPYGEKFGIGTYYNPGETINPDELPALIEAAAAAIAKRNEEQEKANQAAAIKAEERRKYLSQFTRADVRTTTNIIKRHILKTWPSVSKVTVSTDSFSMGSSMDVTYHAPEEIEELERFVSSFQYGHFNGMEDIYEYNSNREAIILEGHILQEYKYSHARFEEAQAPEVAEAEAAEIAPAPAGTIQVIDYSEKAVAVIGETKAIKDQLKELGGSFNPRLSCGPGWIFSKKRLPELQKMLS